jgi:hypothetical protein
MRRSKELALIPEASAEWKIAQSPPQILTAGELAKREAILSSEILRLRVAYPTQARNFSPQETAMLNELWREIFIAVEPIIFREAVMRFITTDRKSFFPSPGQIVGFVEQIIAEREEERKRISDELHWSKVRANDELIRNGEHCGTCKYCRHAFIAPDMYDKGYREWQLARNEEERLKLRIEKLYCENPSSNKYEGEHGYGTARTIRCEYYEPQKCIEEQADSGKIKLLPERKEETL